MTRRIVFPLALVVAALAAGEGGLRLVSWALSSTIQPVPLKISDARLGVRPNPQFPGHDSRGFRNASALNATEIVALGDSQTYGVGVSADQAWPAALQRLTGRVTYNMAFGGWGPLEALALLPDALAMHPVLVIEALYAGNDLYDAFSSTYRGGQRADFAATDGAISGAIVAAEQREPLSVKCGYLFRQLQEPKLEPESEWSRRLSNVSRLWSTLAPCQRALTEWWEESRQNDVDPVERSRQREWRWAATRGALVLDRGRMHTILTPQYRLAALDLADVRVREGERIVFESIERMADVVHHGGAQFLVLLLPTKELAFSELARAEMEGSAAYETLVRDEEQFWAAVKARFQQTGIRYVDAVSPLRDAIRQGTQPYPSSADGHPNAEGQRIIAMAVAQAMRLPGVESPMPVR